ncbi:hypothetical protein [Marinobacterium iners]|uniref:Uncharacterized protein n=1 Tax=Marinobacterium iners DSM 11526 TaxID=1122198 RepID=A0A1H3XA46_9GAMM|nr:hypothetical protein [Marinobacterium iners]SDZ96257.1 hypothetical protein SAMN02745729_10189 [Marinobacterium iners DSM 11526]
MTLSVIQPKQPINPAWEKRTINLNTAYPAFAWYHPALKLLVISAVEVPETAIGPEYHISISKGRGTGHPKRCSAEEGKLVLKQFDAEGALEDNHSPVVRNYWMPVAEKLIGMECDCKEQEAAIREGDFEWRPLTQKNADRAKVTK